MMSNFKNDLDNKIIQSLRNNYGIDNYDEFRFGLYAERNGNEVSKKTKKAPLKYSNLKNIVKTIIGRNSDKNKYLAQSNRLYLKYQKQIDRLWSTLSDKDKKLVTDLVAYRFLGFTKVKLPLNNHKYWEKIELVKSLADKEDTINPNFMHFVLEKFDLNPIGYDVKLYFSNLGIVTDFIIEQYAYKHNDKDIVSVEKGDYVMDLGGCWGDTAIYFAHQAGEAGKVFSFEFIPGNIELFRKNVALNSHLENQIQLVPNPVFNISNKTIHFIDNGPASKVSFEPLENQTGSCTTISIDDFVKRNNIEKIDFIKMDIEGAEPFALEGAIETINRFRPKLAIAIYHSYDDFFNIPNWILDLDLDYEIFIDNFTIHSEETICFAKPREPKK